MKEKKSSKKCPKCGKTDRVKPILYGMPMPTQRVFEKYHIGGCVMDVNNPIWYCERDDLKFGKKEWVEND
ncbi:MAG: hypothetical protein LPK49_01340 [Bacteroidota bacterium]|nr:hypothetical protein [Bacteroidota bacterium]